MWAPYAATGLPAIAVARTTGTRCSRNGSWRRSGRRQSEDEEAHPVADALRGAHTCSERRLTVGSRRHELEPSARAEDAGAEARPGTRGRPVPSPASRSGSRMAKARRSHGRHCASWLRTRSSLTPPIATTGTAPIITSGRWREHSGSPLRSRDPQSTWPVAPGCRPWRCGATGSEPLGSTRLFPCCGWPVRLPTFPLLEPRPSTYRCSTRHALFSRADRASTGSTGTGSGRRPIECSSLVAS
jgi:hypothetical protein